MSTMPITDRPNLDAARRFTRDLGPASMIGGALIAVHGAVLHTMQSAYAAWLVFPLGLVLVLFGAAAFYRTETTPGQLLRWAVVAVFAVGGVYSLLQWSVLIFGSRSTAVQGDPTMMGFYLMAGPALLVPAGLAAVRPGWVPLIVTPAIVSLLGASLVGHGTLLLLDLTSDSGVASPLPDAMLMIGVLLTDAAVLLYSAQRGLIAARQPG